VPVVRSQHLGDGESSTADPVAFFTAGDTGITVVKNLILGTTGYAVGFPTFAFILCQFSGGSLLPLLSNTQEGSPYVASGGFWVVLPPGSQLLLQGDGVNTWCATADGAVLQY